VHYFIRALTCYRKKKLSFFISLNIAALHQREAMDMDPSWLLPVRKFL